MSFLGVCVSVTRTCAGEGETSMTTAELEREHDYDDGHGGRKYFFWRLEIAEASRGGGEGGFT